MKTLEEVDTRLSVMKPIMSQGMIDMYNYFKSNLSIVVNGFKETGIHDALHGVCAKLHCKKSSEIEF